MDAEGWITVVAAVAAWAAVPAAFLSVRYGRSQARSAELARIADTRSSYSAHSSAQSDQQSLALARAAFDRDNQPQFEVKVGPPRDGYCQVEVRPIAGAFPLRVRLDWAAEFWWTIDDPEHGLVQQGHSNGGGTREYTLARNQWLPFGMKIPGMSHPWEPGEDFEPEHVTVKLSLHCVDAASPPRYATFVEAGEWRLPFL